MPYRKDVTEFVEDILQMFISGPIHISLTFKKLTNVNHVLSFPKQIGISFSTSLLNHNCKCYYKMNLDVRVLSFTPHIV